MAEWQRELLYKYCQSEYQYQFECSLQYLPAMSEEAKQSNEQELKQLISHIKAGNTDEVQRMLQIEEALANHIDPQYRQPPLYFAVLSNSDETSSTMIRLLLKHGANARFRDHNDQTILFYIFREGKQLCAEIMISQGLNVDEVDFFGQTPLFYASGQNRVDLVSKYATKERVNHVDKLAAQTAIYYAARRGHLEMCKLLLEKGADITHHDISRRTAVQYAKRAKYMEAASFLENELKKAKLIAKTSESANEYLKKKKKQITLPKNTYNIVYYGQKGECTKLTEHQVLKLIEITPKMKEYLANPDTISEEELNTATADSWEKVALKIVTSCISLKCAYFFLDPVDPIKLNVPDYFDVVSHPSDLRTIKQRLLHNYYTDPSIFKADMNLIWQNSYLYNGELDMVSKLAKELETAFIHLLTSTGFDRYLSTSCNTVPS